MPHHPEDCPFRQPISSDSHGAAVCELVSRVVGVGDRQLCLAQREACEMCCRSLRHRDPDSPVVASLAYNAASRIIASGGHPECSIDRARRLLQCAVGQLDVVLDGLPGCSFPPQLPVPAITHQERSVVPQPSSHAARSLTWATGLMTAPRRVPTIQRTVESLRRAGFASLHIFAEPDSWIPGNCEHFPVTRHQRRLGTLGNFYVSLSKLLIENPAAEVFAMFQDDVEAAVGLKQWCDQQLWPLDAGLVSLFTGRLHNGPTTGWRLLSPGYQRVCGAQALVFRRDMLERFLADPLVIHRLPARRHNNDAVLGGWVARQGLAIAYHTPSLVHHIGEVSSLYAEGPDRRNVACAVSSVDEIGTWQPRSAGQAVIGLVGPAGATGLGYLNHGLATHLGIDRWLIPADRRTPLAAPLPENVRVNLFPNWPANPAIKAWLRGLDWLLFVERPFMTSLVRTAAHAGLGIACVPMWEWLQPHMPWLAFVDVMICPTQHALVQMTDWKRRYGFGWEAIYVPWPVDTERFCFQQRASCRRFLFINGRGGAPVCRLDGSPVEGGRKGLRLVLEAAQLAPHLQFVVYSQARNLGRLPANVELKPSPTDHVDLYRDGDVCVQPSHYEGLGLQLLECQAAGIPLVTTAASPMNEHDPWRTIPVTRSQVVWVGEGPILWHEMQPSDLVSTLEPLVGADLREASRRARQFIVDQHSWPAAISMIRQAVIKR